MLSDPNPVPESRLRELRLLRLKVRYEVGIEPSRPSLGNTIFRTAFWLLAVAVFTGLAYRLHGFTDRFAVNMMYWDQWDFYTPIFKDKGWWAIFTQQHGPHRQGLGFLVENILAHLSHWNSRWDAFAVSFTVIISGIVALLVAVRCGISTRLALIPVALVFFNIRQFESVAGAANLSHGAMPVLLLMLASLAWFIPSPKVRFPVLGVLTFFLIFTGFGVFAGLVIPLIFCIEAVQAFRAKDRPRLVMAGVGLVIVAVSWTLFARGYTFAPAVDNFHFPHERPLEYLYFSGLMLANFFGMPGIDARAIAIGIAITTLLLAVCLWHGWRLLQRGIHREPASTVIFSLSLFVLIYCLNTAVGRVSVGLAGAVASRYVTVMIPAGFALLLHLRFLKNTHAMALGVIYVAFLAAGTTQLRADEKAFVRNVHYGRIRWKRAYLRLKDEVKANERSKFLVYPTPGHITKRLNYLKKHQLNLFDPNAREW